MPKYQLVISTLFLSSLSVNSFAEAWEEKFYNPKPLDKDVILPMPCDGYMVFRRIETGTKDVLEDTKITLGGNTDSEPYAEHATPNYISGSFHEKADSRYFLMGKYEVTAAQYQAVMGDCPTVNIRSTLPAIELSWFDAINFSNKYSEWLLQNHPNSLPTEDGNKGFIRLPTSTEWEFASRGGLAVSESEFRENTFPMPKGNLSDYAWSSKTANGKLQLIGRLDANPLGLFDTLGNASEIMLDNFKANKLNRYHGQEGGMITRGGSYLKSEAQVNNVSKIEVPFYSNTGKARSAKDIGFRVTISAPLLTSGDRIREIESQWKQLGLDDETQEDSNIVGKLEELASEIEDQTLKQEITATRELLRAANQERDEQRASAIRSALQLGAFLCTNVSDLHAKVETDTVALNALNGVEGLEGLLKEAEITFEESEKARDFVLQYYADNLVSTASTYPKSSIEEQLKQTHALVNRNQKANLTQYVDQYWSHLKQYYSDNKVTRNNWLQECSLVKSK